MTEAICIVWRELHRADGRRLAPAEGGDPDLLAATIGNLVRLHGPGAFSGTAAAPRADDAEEAALYQRYIALLDRSDVRQGRLGDTPLAIRAVLWEVENGAPSGPIPLPQSASWVPGSAMAAGDYKVRGDEMGPRYRLWTSSAAPVDAPFISTLSGTGIPATPAPRTGWAWFFGLLGGLGFLWLLISLSYAGSAISDAYRLLQNDRPVRVEKFIRKNGAEICKAFGREPDGTGGSNASCGRYEATSVFPVCMKLLAPSVAPGALPAGLPEATAEQCGALLSLAVAYSARTLVDSDERVLSVLSDALLGWLVPSEGRSISIDLPLILMMACVVFLLVGLSNGVVGRGLGWLISPQNRYSLAVAQASCWTVLLLSSAVGMAAFNSGLGATGAALAESIAPAGFFPTLEPVLWAVLGITLSSPALSMVIKALRGSILDRVAVAEHMTRTQNGIGVLNNAMPVAARPSPADARVTDLFVGEDAANEHRIDISRLQMVMITAGLLVAYGQSILAMVRERSVDTIFLAAKSGTPLFSALPAVGESMLVMLLVSHSTYLISKSVTAKPEPEKPDN